MKEHLWIEKNLWNMLLEANQKKYDEEKKFLTRNDMQKMVKNTGLYSQVAQTLSHRLQRALWHMVKMRKQGKKCGYPRFKSIDRIKSLNYPQYGFRLDKKLKVTPFGEISIKKTSGNRRQNKNSYSEARTNRKMVCYFLCRDRVTNTENKRWGTSWN